MKTLHEPASFVHKRCRWLIAVLMLSSSVATTAGADPGKPKTTLSARGEVDRFEADPTHVDLTGVEPDPSLVGRLSPSVESVLEEKSPLAKLLEDPRFGEDPQISTMIRGYIETEPTARPDLLFKNPVFAKLLEQRGLSDLGLQTLPATPQMPFSTAVEGQGDLHTVPAPQRAPTDRERNAIVQEYLSPLSRVLDQRRATQLEKCRAFPPCLRNLEFQLSKDVAFDRFVLMKQQGAAEAISTELEKRAKQLWGNKSQRLEDRGRRATEPVLDVNGQAVLKPSGQIATRELPQKHSASYDEMAQNSSAHAEEDVANVERDANYAMLEKKEPVLSKALRLAVEGGYDLEALTQYINHVQGTNWSERKVRDKLRDYKRRLSAN